MHDAGFQITGMRVRSVGMEAQFGHVFEEQLIDAFHQLAIVCVDALELLRVGRVSENLVRRLHRIERVKCEMKMARGLPDIALKAM